MATVRKALSFIRMFAFIQASFLATAAWAAPASPNVEGLPGGTHKDVSPIPKEIIEKIKQRQQATQDPLIDSLNAHLNQTFQSLQTYRPQANKSIQVKERRASLLAQGATVANTNTTPAAKAPMSEADLANARSRASSQKLQMQQSRDAFMQRLDAAEQKANAQGDAKRAAQIREFKAKLQQRFAVVLQDLRDIEQSANAQQLQSNAERAAQRIATWRVKVSEQEAARSPMRIPEPNWTQQLPLPARALPKAKQAPKFAYDSMYLLQNRLASSDGYVKVVMPDAPNTPTEAGACAFNTADLTKTTESPSDNPEIKELAAKLNYNPVRIFEWVQQNIAYEPYYGSMKGGLATLWAKAGGATDQASLLIALLRASNIPARYVRGTIAVLDNSTQQVDGRAPRWIGAKSYGAASKILASNSNPSAMVVKNASNNEVGIQLAHVWVEACLPYADYRGVAMTNAGHRWIALDPSYKDMRVEQQGISLSSSFGFDYDKFLSKRLDDTGRYLLPHEKLDEEAQAYVQGNIDSSMAVTDVPYRNRNKQFKFDVLPIVPPYEILSYTSWDSAGGPAEVADLPVSHLYVAKIEVRKAGTSDLMLGMDYRLSQAATARVTLSFKPIDGDADRYNTWYNNKDPDIAPTCSGDAAGISMVPQIKIDGTVANMGNSAYPVSLCSGNTTLQIRVLLSEVDAPTDQRVKAVYTNINASNIHALHVFANHVSNTYLAKRQEQLLNSVNTYAGTAPQAAMDEVEGEYLNIVAAKYSRYMADSSKHAGEIFGESGTVGPAIGLTAAQTKVGYLFDLPYGVSRRGFFIDWPAGIYTGTSLTDANSTDSRAFKMSGFAGSAYEAYIWQENANLDAVSTTRGLQFANETDTDTVTLNAGSWGMCFVIQNAKIAYDCGGSPSGWSYSYYASIYANVFPLAYTDADIESIKTNYIDKGYTVTLPEHILEYPSSGGWRGIAFYAENFNASPKRMSFPIGAHSGGMTVEMGSSSSGNNPSNSGDTIAGGFTMGAPYLGAYNPTLNTGLWADINTPLAKSSLGINSLTGGNGWSPLISFGGDPVNMLTGNYIHNERDISIRGRGGFPIIFERWYNSRDPKDGPLGFGWTHSFNHFIKFYGVEDGKAKLSWNDGTGGERFFSTTSFDSTTGRINEGAVFKGPDGLYVKFERVGSGEDINRYLITERNGMQYLFQGVDSNTAGGQIANAVWIKDRFGNKLTLVYGEVNTTEQYCPANNLCSVIDSLLREIKFSYTGTHITKIKDWTGRTWTYEYDSAGNLITFNNPAAVAGTQNPVRYEYYNTTTSTTDVRAQINHAMKKYILPRGNGMFFEYYTNGRMFRHTPFDTTGALKTDHATTFAWGDFRREGRTIDALGRERVFMFDKYGNPESIRDENGGTTSYTYNTGDGKTMQRKTKTDVTGLVTQYEYDDNGNLSKTLLPSGRSLEYTNYTSYGQPLKTKDADGNWTLLAYTAQGSLTDQISLRKGVNPTVGTTPSATDIVAWSQTLYDSYGNVTRSMRMRYFTGATLGTFAGGRGPTMIYTYSTAPEGLNITSVKRTAIVNNDTSQTSDTFSDFAYDSLGRQTRGPDANWYTATTSYDKLDRVTQSSDGIGNVWENQFDANGNVKAKQLKKGSTYLDGYYADWDDLDRITRRVDYAGNASSTSYNVLGHVISQQDADGYSIGFTRDALGRAVAAYDAEGNQVSTVFDADGKPRSVTDPNNLTTQYQYFGATEDGRLKRTTLPTVSGQTQGRAVEVLSYNGNGQPLHTKVIAADGTERDSYTFYDVLGRVVRQLGPQIVASNATRQVTCYKYDNFGNVIEIWAGATSDTAAETCAFSSDPLLSRQMTATYDELGRKITQTDQNNKTWKWTWNTHGELVSSQTPVQAAAGVRTTYTYGTKGVTGQAQGMLKTMTMPAIGTTAGQTVRYEYNVMGQATRIETRDNLGSLMSAYEYSYDTAHRVASVTDIRPNSTAQKIQYTWTAGGRLWQLKTGEGSSQHVTNFSYDATGRLQNITAPNGTNIMYTYDRGGRLLEKRIGQTSGLLYSNYRWFEDGNLQSLTSRTATTVIASNTYILDAQGRRWKQYENVSGNGDTQLWTYGYDNLDRLTSANAPHTGTESYTYDVFNNRKSKTTNGASTFYTYTNAHELLDVKSGTTSGPLVATAVHNADGQMTKYCEGSTVTATKNGSGFVTDCTATDAGAYTLQLAWDALEQLKSVNRTGVGAITESYAYDHEGRRISKTSAGVTTQMAYNGDDMYAQWSGTAINGNPSTYFVHGAGVDEPLLQLTGTTNSSSANQFDFVQDGLGSIVAMEDNNQLQSVNVALASNLATVSVSSKYSDNYHESSIIDGNRTGNAWGSPGGGWNDGTSDAGGASGAYPDWAQVKFNGAKTINKIEVVTLQNGYTTAGIPDGNTSASTDGIEDFTVEYLAADNLTWVNVATITGNTKAINTFTFAPVTTSSIRVTVTKGKNYYSRIVEIAAWTPIGTPQRFDAWGKKLPGGGTVPVYGYTGREPDATGMMYYRARYYTPNHGRFISRDPMGMVDGVSPYAYVRNAPTMNRDPSGMTAQLAMPGSFSAYLGNSNFSFSPMGTSTYANNSDFGSGSQGLQRNFNIIGTVAANDSGTMTDAPSALAGAIAIGGRAAGGTLAEVATGLSPLGAGLVLPLAIAGDSQQSRTYTYVTYTRVNPKTGQIYAGRTGGYGNPEALVARRAAGQPLLNAEGFAPPVVDRATTNYGAIRGREQQLIDSIGGAQSVGGSARNKINGVADFNPNRPFYMNAAQREFGNLPDNSPARFKLNF